MVNWLNVAEKTFIKNANHHTDTTDETNTFVSNGSTVYRDISKKISKEDEKTIRAWLACDLVK